MRTSLGFSLTLAVVLASAACGNDSASTKSGKAQASSGFVGVDPMIFQCDSITPIDLFAKAVGGPVEVMENYFDVPKGTAPPCSYALTEPRAIPVPDGGPPPGDGGPALAQWMWSITYDCREDFHKSTTAEMERLIREEGATRLEIGKWGIEAKKAVIMFFDEDSPCWVRVVGPGDAERRGIAQLIQSRLTAKNAPMRPRPAP